MDAWKKLKLPKFGKGCLKFSFFLWFTHWWNRLCETGWLGVGKDIKEILKFYKNLPTTLLRASPDFQTFLRPCIRLVTNLIFCSAIFVLAYDQLGSQFQSSSQFQQMWINKFVIVFTTPIIIKVIEPSLNGFHDKFPFIFITFGFIKYFLTSF